MPGHDTPQDLRVTIGDALLNRFDARDVRLREGGHPDIAVVDFRLGDTDQYLVVCRVNLWPKESFVSGARFNKRGVLSCVPHAAAYFTELSEIPAAIEAVAARKDEW